MFSRTTTWFNQGAGWLTYLARCQHLLRQGLPVADLVYFAGAKVPVNTTTDPKMLNSTPPLGYDYDVTNAAGILNRMRAEDGQIYLSDGMSYRLLILPEDRILTLELLRKIRHLVMHGATVVGPKPEHTPGLTGYPENDNELRRLAEEVWGELDGTIRTERSFGQGRVFWEESLTTVLDKLNIRPDFEFTSRSGDAPINYIHRRVDDADLYFVANRRRQSEEVVCTFRVTNRQPEIWSPETGEVTLASVWEPVEAGTRLPLRLGPCGSVLSCFVHMGRRYVIDQLQGTVRKWWVSNLFRSFLARIIRT